MRDLRHLLTVSFALSAFLLLLQNGYARSEEKTEEMLPVASLYQPDEIKTGFDRQKITPFDDPKFYFEILVPKDWDSRPFEVSKQDLAEADAGQTMVRMALFTPNSENEQNVLIETHFMRVPALVQLTEWMNTVLKNMDYKILARQRGEYNERMVEDALLEKDGEGPVLTRFTASRHGDYIFIVSSSAPKDQYPKYKRIFGLAAVTFNPLGMESSNTPLKIANFSFLQAKNGPPRTEGPFKPQESVYATYETTGFALDQQGRPHLLSEMAALDPAGLPLFKPIKDEIHPATSGQNAPVSNYLNFELPSYAPAGQYNVRIRVHDSVKSSDHELMQPFRVEGGPTATAKHLEFRDCKFSLSKNGPPAKPLTAKPGGQIHSSCKIAGMQFREDRMDVQISVQVAGPLGKIIFEKPDLIVLKGSYFYRPATFFEEISAWVSLPSDAAPGKYTWKFKMNDRIANAGASLEEEFEVK